MAQLVCLVEPAEPAPDVQLTRLLALPAAQPEDGVSRWEDDGGAVPPAFKLAA